jgi:hypothetical protein
MTLNRKRSRRRATFVGAVVGSILIFTFVLTLIAPDLASRRSDGSSAADSDVIGADFNPDLPIEVEAPYIHSSGFFQTFQPVGSAWELSEFMSGEPLVYPSVFIRDATTSVVVHHYVQPGVVYDSGDALSQNYLTIQYFASQWQQYDKWLETVRAVDGDTVTVDFELESAGEEYLGRDISRLQDSWLYVTRLVVPADNADLLTELQNKALPAFIGYQDLQGMTERWPVYTDQQLGFALKHAPGWSIQTGDAGRPVTFEVPLAAGQPEVMVRMEAMPGQPLAADDEAEAWLADHLADKDAADITVVAGETVTRQFGSGYALAYQYREPSGDQRSGLAVLLNDARGTLFLANLDLDAPGANMLDVEDPVLTGDMPLLNVETWQAVREGFIVLPPAAS